MKKQIAIRIIILTGALLFPLITQAQGMTYISNLGQSSAANAAIGSDSWLALSFSTGTNSSGYQLNSIRLGMANAMGNPNGFTVMLYSAIESGNASVGNSLGALNGSLNPVAGGTFTYIPTSNLMLAPNTPYFIVLTAGTIIASGAYELADSSVGPVNYNPIGGWQAPVSVAAEDNYQSSNGSNWGLFFASPEYAINATAVPEPDMYALLCIAGLCFFGLRKGVIGGQPPNQIG
jgi:hypothetical protein